nr:T9SS type A sorting domain-containing protein [Ignavibacteria bacterium]
TAAKLFKMNFTVGINQLSSEVPEDFSLSQNYPNPFNPTTKIKFEIQKASDVKLVVYNSLGKEISTLVNKKLNAGTYETDFSGAAYNSGIYFYRLFISGEKNFIETKKMILTK